MSDTPDEVPTFEQRHRMALALERAGVSVQDMADYLEISRSSVGHYLSGRRAPPGAVLRLWAMRCHVPYEWLKSGEGPAHADASGVGPTNWYLMNTPQRHSAAISAA